MTWTASSCFATLAILFLWRVEEIAEACRCYSMHPQKGFCISDVVIRAKLLGVQEVVVGNNIRIKYDVEQIKMFKGPSQDIDAIYTVPDSCGVTDLKTDGTQYIITGRLEADGTMHITLCDFLKPWEALSATQRNGVNGRYAVGCDCKITLCTSIPCSISSPEECMWTDLIIDNTIDGEQAKHSACVKWNDSCFWIRMGAAHPDP